MRLLHQKLDLVALFQLHGRVRQPGGKKGHPLLHLRVRYLPAHAVLDSVYEATLGAHRLKRGFRRLLKCPLRLWCWLGLVGIGRHSIDNIVSGLGLLKLVSRRGLCFGTPRLGVTS